MANTVFQGFVRKMRNELVDGKVQYQLPIGDDLVDMNALIGEPLRLRFEGNISCQHCGRKTKKSFSQGYCYPCFQRLAQCDSCIMSPEKCHYSEGTCREPEWADEFCMTDHYVYLANSSGLKVGITRGTQIPTRWMDQGAVQALPIFKVSNRLQSGLVEVAFKDYVADKTSWQAMLKGAPVSQDMFARRDELMASTATAVADLKTRFGDDAILALPDAEVVDISYPVDVYPSKVKSHNLDKTPEAGGVLMGIKGQYLMFDTGVLNIRKYTAYELSLVIGAEQPAAEDIA